MRETDLFLKSELKFKVKSGITFNLSHWPDFIQKGKLSHFDDFTSSQVKQSQVESILSLKNVDQFSTNLSPVLLEKKWNLLLIKISNIHKTK